MKFIKYIFQLGLILLGVTVCLFMYLANGINISLLLAAVCFGVLIFSTFKGEIKLNNYSKDREKDNYERLDEINSNLVKDVQSKNIDPYWPGYGPSYTKSMYFEEDQ